MKIKDIVIKKILDLGKKSKILMYPALALVAIVSAISYLFYWSKGNRKKLVATLLAVVLIFSQSYFLTSSASSGLISEEVPSVGSEAESTEISASEQGATGDELINTPQDPVGVPDVTITAIFHSYDSNGDALTHTEAYTGQPGSAVSTLYAVPSANSYYSYTGWYTTSDASGTQYSDGTYMLPATTQTVNFYLGKNVIAYKLSITDIYTLADPTAHAADYVVTKTGESTTYTLDASDFHRVGYTFSGITAGAGRLEPNTDGDIVITLSGNVSEVIYQTVWTPISYSIKYKLTATEAIGGLVTMPAGVTEFSDTFVYGTANKINSNLYSGLTAFVKRGYLLSGWSETQNATTATYTKGQIVNDTLYVEGATSSKELYPVWQYVGFELNSQTASFEYGETGRTYTYVATYGEGSETIPSDFTYEVSNVDKNAMTALGLTLNANNTTHEVTLSGTPIMITSGAVQFNIKVTDSHDATKTYTYPVSLTITKKVITVTGVANNYKTYDGTTSIAVGKISFSGAVNGDELAVNCTDQSGNFSTAAAGTNKYIALTGLTLSVTGSTPESVLDYYTLASTASVTGNVLKRTVHINTSANYTTANPTKIFTGESDANANFQITEVPSSNPSENILSAEATTNQANLRALLGITGFSVSTDAWTIPGTYDIDVVTSGTSNYEVSIKNKGKLTVDQETPIKDTNYTIAGTVGSNGWYKNVVITPISNVSGYYNQICQDGGSYVGSLSLLEEDYVALGDGIVNIRLKNSTTGAVTSAVDVSDIKVDSTAPVLDNYSITQGSANVLDGVPGTRIPGVGSFLTYGNYFKNTIDINMTFAADTSGNATLYYDLANNGSYTPVTIVDNKASFSIVEGSSELINFYVVDNAGNSLGSSASPQSLVKNSTNVWKVEATAPSIDLFVKNQSGTVIISGDNKYYSKGDLTARITDNGSGIYGIKWIIDGVTDSSITEVTNQTSKETTVDFTKTIAENGNHIISAIAYDNAGNYNEVEDPIEFNVDNDKPVITITSGGVDTWIKQRTIEFTVSDPLSGIKYVDVKDSNREPIEYTKTVNSKNQYTCSVTLTEKGTYYLCAYDEAGNEIEKELIFNNISATVPAPPIVVVSPGSANGSNGWYNSSPTVSIDPAGDIDSGTTGVNTYYKIWQGSNEPKNATKVNALEDVLLDTDGIWHIKAYSISDSDIKCATDVVMDVNVDLTKPVVTMKEATKEEEAIKVNFLIADGCSGVNLDSVKVTYNGKNVGLTVTPASDGNGYIGSFEVDNRGEYIISCSDKAGNVSDSVGFEPISMKIKQVTNISTTTAVVGAMIYKGSYNISAYQLKYKKSGDEEYKEVTVNAVTDGQGNVSISYPFTGLTPDSIYYYKIVALSAAGENLTYEGSFKTLSETKTGISVSGKVRYADIVSDEIKTQNIIVALYDSSTCIRSVEKVNGDMFTFDNIPDGSYNIIATNGTYTATAALVIEGGYIVYPDNTILLVLGGQSTSVVITTEDTPSISVVGLDDIFEYDSSNYTAEDKTLIAAGGTVEFKLYATLMRVSGVSENDISATYEAIGSSGVVGAYLNLTLYKIRTDVDGICLSKEVVTEIGGTSLKIIVPLGEMANKLNIRVVRNHEGVADVLSDVDNNNDTYTVATNKFSTYAVVYDAEVNSTEATTATNSTTATTTTTTDKTATVVNTSVNDKTKKVTGSTSISSLANDGSPQTGDGNPIIIIFGMLFISTVGYIWIRKRIKRIT